MVRDQILDLGMKRVEDVEVGRHHGTLTAVTTGEVLGRDDGNDLTLLASHQQHLAVVVGKVGGVDYLRNERPQFERLVRGLVVKNKVEAIDQPGLLDEEQTADELFAD